MDLIVKVERIPETGLDLTGHLDPLELQHCLDVGGDTGLTTPAGGDIALRFERIEQAVRITGQVSTTAAGTCGRCLGPAQLALTARVDVTLFPAPSGRHPEADDAAADTAGADQQADLDDSGAMSGTYRDGRIDAGDLLREVLLLELPIQFVCRDSCAGLCDQCGANLNLGPCGCVRQQIDPRWEGLKSIKVP
ncbi:MAG: DUF177 domain-containing protein [Deltaproteobacteria bacterium]|nr:DUF177 domain-containing protein [Deltaproteobacteria bacterium]